jgi:hypothetical protein
MLKCDALLADMDLAGQKTRTKESLVAAENLRNVLAHSQEDLADALSWAKLSMSWSAPKRSCTSPTNSSK